MKQLYSARYAPEAHELRLFLSAHDIEAKVTGDNNVFEAGFAFTPQSAPCVFVEDADFERASALLAQFRNRPSSSEPQREWRCPECHEVVESQFDLCWKCGTPRGDAPLGDALPAPIEDEIKSGHDDAMPPEVVAPAVAGSTRSTWMLWLEVIAVFALTKPLYGGRSLVSVAVEALGLRNTGANLYLPKILSCVFAVIVVLTVIRLSGDSWTTFGIKKPTWLDVLSGSIVCAVIYFGATMGVSLFVDILESMYSARDVYQITHTHSSSYHVHGWIGLVTILVLAISAGLSEELVARGYLIPRLERLLHSTWVSVLISAAVFGLLHWPSGVLTMCHAFLGGIVYGIAFAWTRRLWPVVIAHSIYDFSAMLSHAG